MGPEELVRQARMAEQAGFERLWISDHFHPWTEAQGNSPFVWSVIGALSQVTSLPITTAVTCPTVRIHPAIIAQAAATAAVQCQGRFVLGVGTGEALNELILGDRWPPAGTRMRMLREAVEIIRALHRGEELIHHGEHYTVEHARIYTLPEKPVPIYVSAFGSQAARLAGEVGDGFCSAIADADLVNTFRDSGGGDRPAQAGLKVCAAETAEEGVETAHRLWANEQLPGQLGQTLARPRDFEAASSLVDRDTVAQQVPCGPDIEQPLAMIEQLVRAGYDEVYVQQIGPEQQRFFDTWSERVLPRARQM